MCSATSLYANLVTDMPTNPANLVTDMPANPTVVHLHAKMLAFCNITQWKPCNIHVYKPYSCSPARKNVCFLNQYSMQTLLHTCTQKCMDSMAIPLANLGTNMFTNPTVVQLRIKMLGFHGYSHIGELKCMQNIRENMPQSSMYAKYAGNLR